MFRLALAVGCPHPDYLYRLLTSKQISEWIAYSSLEPFGVHQGYYQAGIVSSTIANVNKGKSTKPFTPMDFVPGWAKPYKKTVKMKNPKETITNLATALGASRKKKRRKKRRIIK